jgi:hypothetical protein
MTPIRVSRTKMLFPYAPALFDAPRSPRGFLVIPLSVLLISCEGGASASPSQRANLVQAEQPLREIFIDTTASIDPSAVRTFYPSVASSAVPTGFVGTIWVVPFADKGWNAVGKDSISFPGYRDADCTELNERIRRTTTARRKEELRAECRSKTDSIRGVVDGLRVAARAELRNAVQPRALDSSVCTALWEVIQRVQRRSGPYAALIITDGNDTCGPKPKSIPPPSGAVRVVVVVVPSSTRHRHGRSELVLFDETRARIQQVAPWVVVLSPHEVVGSIF